MCGKFSDHTRVHSLVFPSHTVSERVMYNDLFGAMFPPPSHREQKQHRARPKAESTMTVPNKEGFAPRAPLDNSPQVRTKQNLSPSQLTYPLFHFIHTQHSPRCRLSSFRFTLCQLRRQAATSAAIGLTATSAAIGGDWCSRNECSDWWRLVSEYRTVRLV